MRDVPYLERYEQLSPALRPAVAAELLRRYNDGKSIRDLCRETSYSVRRVKTLLVEAGVTFRGRGGPRYGARLRW